MADVHIGRSWWILSLASAAVALGAGCSSLPERAGSKVYSAAGTANWSGLSGREKGWSWTWSSSPGGGAAASQAAAPAGSSSSGSAATFEAAGAKSLATGGGGGSGAGSGGVGDFGGGTDPGIPDELLDPGFSMELFEMIIPSPGVQGVAVQLGFDPIPLVPESRFIDPDTGDYSFAHYQNYIWRPDLTFGIPESFGSETRYGIPPGWTTWVLLDYENWDISNPNIMNNFVNLTAGTRTLRPDADIAQYWRPDLNTDEATLQAENTILSLADAIAPPLYLLDSLDNLPLQMYTLQARVEYCIDMGIELGLRVYPIVWKRYGAGQDADGNKIQALLTAELIEAVVEFAMTERQGVRADGIMVFGNDNVVRYYSASTIIHPENPTQEESDVTDIQCLSIVAQVAEAHRHIPPVATLHPEVTVHLGGSD